MNQINAEMLDELNNTKGNIRAITLVYQSHVEFYVDEILELLFETTKLQKTNLAFEKKLSILRELDYLSKNLSNDLIILFNIRNRLGHERKTHDIQTKLQILTDLTKIKLVTSPKNDILDEIRRFKPNMVKSKLLNNFSETIKYVFGIFVFQVSHVYNMAYETKTQKQSLKNMFKVN